MKDMRGSIKRRKPKMTPQERQELLAARRERDAAMEAMARQSPLERALSMPDDVKRAFEEVTGLSVESAVEATYRRMDADKKEVKADAISSVDE